VNLEGDLTISVEMPAKYLRKESIILGNAAIDIVEGLNGAQAWQEQKFSGNMNFGDDGGGGGNRGGGNRGWRIPESATAAGQRGGPPIRRRRRPGTGTARCSSDGSGSVLLAILMTTGQACAVRRPGHVTAGDR
jgi:hypothetical protein